MATITNVICTNNKEIDIQGGTGNLNIGTKASANAVVVGNTTGGSSLNLNFGTGNFVCAGVDASTLTFGTATQTGTINFGSSSNTNIINLGNGAGSTTVNISNNNAAGAVNIMASATTATISIGGAAQTGLITLGSSTGTNTIAIGSGVGAGTINIGTGAIGAKAVNIATGASSNTLIMGSTNTASSVTINTGSGGITIPSFSSYGALVSTSAGVITDAAAGTSGFVLTSNGTSSLPTFQANAGGGIGTINGNTGSISGPTVTIQGSGGITTSGSGTTLTITGGGITWNDQTSGSVTMVASNAYVVDNGASLVTLTLPATAALGATFQVGGFSSGGWTVAQAASQLIHFGSSVTTTGTGGSLSSTNAFDQVTITCVVANTTFVVTAAVGNLTVV